MAAPSLTRGLRLVILAAVGCAAPTQGILRPPFQAQGVFYTPTSLVVSNDDDLLPSLAAQGGRIAYAARANGNLDIMVRPLDGGSAVRLTHTSTDDTDPAFSPDGTRIAWVSQADDVKGDIWVMDSDGKDKRRLTGRDTADQAPTWSPDGGTLYFTSRTPGSPVRRIDALDVKTAARRTVVPSGWDAAVAPKGDVLFYVNFIGPQHLPGIVAHRLRDGAEVPLTSESLIEATPHAAANPDGTTVVVFSRFVDDQDGDGVLDVDDTPSLWSVTFTDARFAGTKAAAPRPLTAGEGGEIFASVLQDWLVYTATGRGTLELFALPLTGVIAPDAAGEAVLQSARGTANPALRRLALRHVVATQPALAGVAHYELARELAERGRFAAAQAALDAACVEAGDTSLRWVASLEKHRLDILAAQDGRLGTHPDVAALKRYLHAAAGAAAGHPHDAWVQVRATLIAAEGALLQGHRAQGVAALEACVAHMPAGLDEDGARALDLLGAVYEDLQDLPAVARVCEMSLRRFGHRGFYAERTAERWVRGAQASVGLAPAAALEAMVRRYADLPVLAGRAAAALARRQTAGGQHHEAWQTWQNIVDTYPSERAVLAEALLALGAAGDSHAPTARTAAMAAYERLLADFPDAPDLRAQARGGITAMALAQAQAQERQGKLEEARRTYQRLLVSNRQMVLATRRYIALSHTLGQGPKVLAEAARAAMAAPRDIHARYTYGYALTFVSPPALDDAEREMDAVLDLEPRFAPAQLTLGWVRHMRERQAPGHGWLESAVESFETARSLLDAEADADLWAAATLNKGNALFALGKLDDAFAAYLAREHSSAAFESELSEILFREAFSRVALRVGALDVAVDMAYLARHQSLSLAHTPRRAAMAALLGALNLELERFADALPFYEEALALYTPARDWAHVVPLLRGKALSLQALGQDAAALQTFACILTHLRQDEGPPSPPQGVLRTEIAANPSDITAAVYGFAGEQEEQIARASTARILARQANFPRAQAFASGRLALLRREGATARQAPRVRLEMLYALHESARMALQAGDAAGAMSLWGEAMPLSASLNRWEQSAIIAQAAQTVWLQNTHLRRHPAAQAITEVAVAGAGNAPALARFLSLEALTEAFAPDAATPGASPEGALKAALSHIDRALGHAQRAAHYAAQSGDAALQVTLERLLGVVSPRLAPEPTGWRQFFEQALSQAQIDGALHAPSLDAAIAAYAQQAPTYRVPEQALFVAAAAERLDAQAAWAFLERDRLLDLQPSPSRLQGHPLALLWQALIDARPHPDAYAQQAAAAPAGVRALEGLPVALAAVQEALEGDATFLQVFAPDARTWHWFIVDARGLQRVITQPSTLLPAAVQKAMGPSPQTVYVDGGPILRAAALQPTNAAPWRDVLSATYLVAAYEARDWGRLGAPPLDKPANAAWVAAQDAAPATFAAQGHEQAWVHLGLPAHSTGPAWGRAGLAQVVFAPDPAPDSSLDLAQLAQQPWHGNAAWVSHLTPSIGLVQRRAIMQSLLWAGIPTGAFGANQSEPFGYRGMDADAQLRFAAAQFIRSIGQGLPLYKQAQKTADLADLRRADKPLTRALSALMFLLQPAHRARAQILAAQDKKLNAVVSKLQSFPTNVRGMLAESARQRGAYDEAVALRQAIVQDAAGAPDLAADAEFNLGKTLFLAGRHEEAAQHFSQCAAAQHARADLPHEAECLKWLGDERRSLYDFAGAESAFTAAIALWESCGSAAVAEPRRALGLLYETLTNDYDRALQAFERSLTAAQGDMRATVQLDMARIHRLRGDYEEALRWVDRARHEPAAGPESRCDTALEAARIDWYRGAYRRARVFQQEGLNLAQQAGNRFREVQARSLGGLIALNQGDLAEAEGAITDALALARSLGNRREEAAQLNNLGFVRRDAGRLTEAMQSFQAALQLDDTLNNTEGRAYDLRNMAITMQRQGRNQEALKILDEALALSRKMGIRYNALQCELGRGEILEALNDPEAITVYTAVRRLSQTLNVPEVEWRALYALGRMQAAEARHYYALALAVAERLGRGRQEGGGGHSRDDLYSDALALAIQANDLAAAYLIGERARGRALLDVLATRVLDLPPGPGKTALEGEMLAREAWLGALRQQDPNRPSVEAAARHQEALAALFAQAPATARAFTITPVPHTVLQQVLPAHTGALSFFVGPHQTVAMLLTGQGLQATTLPLPGDGLAAQVATVHNKMRAFAPVDAELEALSRCLLAPVWQAFAAALQPIEALVVVPHGVLFDVPFGALPLGGQPLWARLPLTQALTLSHLADTLAAPRPSPPQHTVALAPADDLPFARLEAQAVGNTLWQGANADRAHLLNALQTADAVDIAAHGSLDKRDPLGSALFLAAPQVFERFELRDVFALSHIAPLVSLSACDGVGVGDAWLGLGQAFLTAGARTVVASHNRVSDLAAALLMKHFYRLLPTQPAPVALQQAALRLRKTYIHPAHWAAFTILGDPR